MLDPNMLLQNAENSYAPPDDPGSPKRVVLPPSVDTAVAQADPQEAAAPPSLSLPMQGGQGQNGSDVMDLIALASLANAPDLLGNPQFKLFKNHPGVNSAINSTLRGLQYATMTPAEKMMEKRAVRLNHEALAKALMLAASRRLQAMQSNRQFQAQQDFRNRQLEQEAEQNRATNEYREKALELQGRPRTVQEGLAPDIVDAVNAGDMAKAQRLIDLYQKPPAQSETDKYVSDYLASNNLPDTPANRMKARTALQKMKGATAFGAFYNERQRLYFDPTNNELIAGTLTGVPGNPNAVPASEGTIQKALTAKGMLHDLNYATQKTAEAIQNIKTPFSAVQAGQLRIALTEPKTTAGAAAMQRLNQTLTPEQLEYVKQLQALREVATSLRVLLGSGRVLEAQANAMMTALPGPTAPSKQFAIGQLQRLRETLAQLEKGVPRFKGEQPVFGNGQASGVKGTVGTGGKQNDPLGIF